MLNTAPLNRSEQSRTARSKTMDNMILPPNIIPNLATRAEVATLLRVNRSYLDHAALNGDGPPFFKVGRAVRYDMAAVAEWLLAQSNIAV